MSRRLFRNQPDASSSWDLMISFETNLQVDLDLKLEREKRSARALGTFSHCRSSGSDLLAGKAML